VNRAETDPSRRCWTHRHLHAPGGGPPTTAIECIPGIYTGRYRARVHDGLIHVVAIDPDFLATVAVQTTHVMTDLATALHRAENDDDRIVQATICRRDIINPCDMPTAAEIVLVGATT